VEAPKLRTVTSYGAKLIKANSAYVYTIAPARIRLLERIIEMLETRILCYNDLAKGFSRSIGMPPWFSDNIADYWDIAGLPRTISGVFYSPNKGAPKTVQIPAVLSFVSPFANRNVSGWFFAVGESKGFSIFIESRSAAKKIYSRMGKTPKDLKLRLNCNLYINNSVNFPLERDVINRCLKPYRINVNVEGMYEVIKIRVIFDGETFELREYPKKHPNAVIFKGTF
jgi:hypothetical protein